MPERKLLQMMTLLLACMALDGLQITDTQVGKGPIAEEGDVVTVIYKGTLNDGTVFDESTPSKPPIAFKIGSGEVIPGWDKGLRGMRVGGKRTLVIPPDMGYGDQANGVIPASSTLNFTTELLRIDKKDSKGKIETKVLKPGKGTAAKEGDTVTVHYVGSFLNGFVFADSHKEPKPAVFTLIKTKLIAGFFQSVIGMKPGEKKVVTVGYQMAYGEEGRPPVIPRYSTLKFELELLKIGK